VARTLQPAEITAFLQGAESEGDAVTVAGPPRGELSASSRAPPPARVVFVTYHSAAKVAEALQRSGQRLDLLICDEAHVTAGHASKRDALALDDGRMPATKRLFLTATPRLFQRQGAAAEGDDVELAASMDDVASYGEVVYRLAHGEAVRRGVVAPLKLLFLNVTEARARPHAPPRGPHPTTQSAHVPLSR
jgi:predicted helicase